MMLANSATVLIGLWLAYRVIFAIPPGDMSELELVAAGVVVIVLAAWARRTDVLAWHSGATLGLGAIILLLAAARRIVAIDPLVLFWAILLIGITVAVAAMWSILYRPESA